MRRESRERCSTFNIYPSSMHRLWVIDVHHPISHGCVCVLAEVNLTCIKFFVVIFSVGIISQFWIKLSGFYRLGIDSFGVCVSPGWIQVTQGVSVRSTDSSRVKSVSGSEDTAPYIFNIIMVSAVFLLPIPYFVSLVIIKMLQFASVVP